jgi:thioesterase domain-containing protein
VAFEIAKSLERMGERVAFLASIDGPPDMRDPKGPMDDADCAVHLAFFLGLVDRRMLLNMPRQVRRLPKSQDRHAYILQVCSRERLAQLDLTVEKFKGWSSLSHSLVRIGESYVPTGRVQKMHVFYAEPLKGTREAWLLRLKDWKRHTRMRGRFIKVRGEHHTLLDPEHVGTLHAVLKTELDRALPDA